ncbi:MAG TPA: acylphosphatase [Thiobacillaceae bacterium]|nr:acylphosphatase [Thiobacillaceae bacterium]
MPVIARQLRITGRVQGVWYRESMRQAADRFGVAGWVRNRLDGTVEALVQGETAAVEAIIAWAWQGPSGARVDEVTVAETAPAPHAAFEKRDTA